MRRVVITGMGVVSCLGNSKSEVLDSIKTGKSGITFNESFKDIVSNLICWLEDYYCINSFNGL